MISKDRLDLHQPAAFYNSVEPVDIKPAALGDDWFLSALATLAERPVLIERIFLLCHVQEKGIDCVKLCKNDGRNRSTFRPDRLPIKAEKLLSSKKEE